MKLKIKLLAMVVLITTVALGQRFNRPANNMSPEQMAQKRAETLKAKLKLSDDQYNQVYNEILNGEKEMRSHRESMKKLRDDRDAKMKTILTPEQYSQLKEMQSERREMMKSKRGQNNDHSEMETPPGNK